MHVLRDVVAQAFLPELLARTMHDLSAGGFRLVQGARDHGVILIEHVVQQESRTRIRGQPFQHTEEGDRQIAGGFQHVLGRGGVIGQQRLGQPHAHIVFARMPGWLSHQWRDGWWSPPARLPDSRSATGRRHASAADILHHVFGFVRRPEACSRPRRRQAWARRENSAVESSMPA